MRQDVSTSRPLLVAVLFRHKVPACGMAFIGKRSKRRKFVKSGSSPQLGCTTWTPEEKGRETPIDTDYRGPGKSMQILLSNSQAGPGRTIKQGQDKFLATTYTLFPGALYIQKSFCFPRFQGGDQTNASMNHPRFDEGPRSSLARGPPFSIERDTISACGRAVRTRAAPIEHCILPRPSLCPRCDLPSH